MKLRFGALTGKPALLLFAVIFGATQARGTEVACARIKLLVQGKCDHLEGEFDLTACGDSTPLHAKIKNCTERGATLFARRKGIEYSIDLKAMVVGYDWTWLTKAPITMAKKKSGRSSESASVSRAPAQIYTDEHRMTNEVSMPAKDKSELPSPTPTVAPPPGTAAAVPVSSATPSQAPFLYGDFRYRHEQLMDGRNSPASTNQQRIRARLGIRSQIADDTLIDFRLATGTGRTGTNQTFTGADANYSIMLDRAYFKFSPTSWMNIYGGRMPNLHYITGTADFIWDTDVNLDGLHVLTEQRFGDYSVFANSGFFWLQKRTATGPSTDEYAVSVQVGAKRKFSEKTRIVLTAAYYDFIALEGNASLDLLTNNGNSYIGTKYAVGYKVFNPAVEFTTELFEKPIIVFGEYAQNFDAVDENNGFIAGMKYGRLAKRGDLQLNVDYRRVGADMTVAAFTDADSYGGGTNGKSWRFTLSYKVRDAWHVGCNFFTGQRNLMNAQTAVDEERFHIDLVFGF